MAVFPVVVLAICLLLVVTLDESEAETSLLTEMVDPPSSAAGQNLDLPDNDDDDFCY